jgi:hypothetical protein
MATQYWWLRRGGLWDSFDADPFRSYYKFLRAVYGLTATEAFNRAQIIRGVPVSADDEDEITRAYEIWRESDDAF